MLESLTDFYKATSILDLLYMLITILSLIKCYRKGFVLSVLSMAKWLVAYIITLIIFPRAKPFLEDVIDNEYVLDIVLGLSIFIIVLFIVLMINKGISKAVSYSGIGTLDKINIEKPKTIVIEVFKIATPTDAWQVFKVSL